MPAEVGTNTRKFTGHERDAETGLDYMMARYYSAPLGRFLAVDPGDDTDPKDPQSWNKYTYVRNNPLKTIDPTGTDGIGIPTSQAQLNQMTARAIAQQLAPVGRAMEAANQAKTAETAGKAVVKATCDAAPSVGKIANGATVTLLAATVVFPPAAETTLPAAGATSRIAAGADALALACKPSPETAATVVGDVIGEGAAATTAKILKDAAPALASTTKEGAALATGEVMSQGAKPAIEKTIETVKKK
jgi:RHS repeat-associated protein